MPEAPGPGQPAGWLPPAVNRGYAFPDRIGRLDLEASAPGLGRALTLSAFYAARYPHSSRETWLERLAAGEICRNGRRLQADGALQPGDRLVWHRPPWLEPAVPDLPSPLFDDGDLLVLAKPSGLPVLPAGGCLEHTVLRLLERQVAAGCLDAGAGVPRPVHRLGRFTSGLLVCARRPASRAWLSALLRDSTAAVAQEAPPAGGRAPRLRPAACRKLYRALIGPLPAAGAPEPVAGQSLRITTPIGRRPHPLLGEIWAAGGREPLPAESTFTLLERRTEGWLVAVAIATGRPHQIRIHAAALGAPLLGDPLYGPGGAVQATVLPGAGGYLLHAHQISLPLPAGQVLELEAPLPLPLRQGLAAST